jgi:hypothetical protein
VGPGCQRRGVKEKGEGEGGLAREVGWAAWAEKEPVRFCFFSFPFSNFIFKSFFFSNSIQTFSNFSQKFCKLFRNHTSNQNHASQLMMHIHLLSLSLLNYL